MRIRENSAVHSVCVCVCVCPYGITGTAWGLVHKPGLLAATAFQGLPKLNSIYLCMYTEIRSAMDPYDEVEKELFGHWFLFDFWSFFAVLDGKFWTGGLYRGPLSSLWKNEEISASLTLRIAFGERSIGPKSWQRFRARSETRPLGKSIGIFVSR